MNADQCEEAVRAIFIDDMCWHREHADNKKLRKALEEVLSFYMTYQESCEYFGEKKANKLWRNYDV